MVKVVNSYAATFDYQHSPAFNDTETLFTFRVLPGQSAHECTFSNRGKPYEPNAGDSGSRNIESSWFTLSSRLQSWLLGTLQPPPPPLEVGVKSSRFSLASLAFS